MTQHHENIENKNEIYDAVQTMGALFGIHGLQVELKEGEGSTTYLTRQGLVVQIDPSQLARNKDAADTDDLVNRQIRESDALFVAGEQIGHISDILKGDLPRTANEKDRFFWSSVHDTARDVKLRKIPLLDSVADDIFQNVRFPERDLSERPKHVQFMESVLLGTVVPNGEWQYDAEVEQLVQALRNYEFGSETVDILEAMSHPDTSLRVRVQIAERFLKPIFEELFWEDVENGQADPSDAEDSQESGDGESSDGESGENGDSGDESSSDGQKSQSSSQQSSPGSGENSSQGSSPSDQFNADYQDYQKAMRGGDGSESQQGDQSSGNSKLDDMTEEQMQALRDAMENGDLSQYFDEDGAGEDGDESEADSGDEGDMESQLAGNVQKEMKLSEKDSRKYVEILMKYRDVISATADALLKLSNLAQATQAPKYQMIADEKGRRIHPGRLMDLHIEERTGVNQSFWQPLEAKNVGSEMVFGGLDITLGVDISMSMMGANANNAAAVAIILLEAKDLAVHRAQQDQQIYNPDDVRTRVLGFGSSTVELSPMSSKVPSREKGRIFKNMIEPHSTSTLVTGTLKEILKTAHENPKRDQIVFMITDAQYADIGRAKPVAAEMPENVHLSQIEVRQLSGYALAYGAYGPYYAQTTRPDSITPNNRIITDPADIPKIIMSSIHDYVEMIEQSMRD